MVSGAHEPVWVDRTAELGVLESSLALVREGQPRAVLVMGETGVGKTALVREFARRAEVRSYVGRCFKFGGGTVPYLPLVEILRSFARDADQAEVVRVLGPARADLARLLPELASRASDGARPGGGESEHLERARLYERLLGVAERLGRDQPTFLVIEDAHWIDDSTRDMLVFLLHTVRSAQLMLVVTCRSEELPPGHPFLAITAELARAGVLERLDLGRLARSDVEQQVAQLIGHTPDAGLVERIVARSRGNPLFVEELLKSEREMAGQHVPTGLRDILLGRVAELSEPSRALVRFAAIAGQRIEEPVLAAAGLSGDELVSALREASDEQVLIASDRPGDASYEFRHPLLQEVVYDDQLPAERARAHAEIARILAETKPTAPGTTAELANHWYEAHEFARALPAAVEAGVAAYLAYAFAEANRQFERALELWPKVPFADDRVGIDRLALLEYASESATRIGDYPRAVALGREQLALIDADADPTRAALAHSRLRWVLWESGDHAAAMADAREAVRLAPADPPSALRANALAHLAALLMFAGKLEAALAMATEGVDVARKASATAEEALAIGIVGLSQVHLGNVAEGLGNVGKALDVAKKLDHVTGLAVAYSQYAAVLDQLGRAEDALAVAREGIETAQHLGLGRTFGVLLRGTAAHALYELGEWDEAARLVARSGSGMSSDQQAQLALVGALVTVGRGQLDEAEAVLAGAPAAASAQPADAQLGALRLMAIAELRLAQKRPTEARVALEDAAGHRPAGPWAIPRELIMLLARAEADVAEAARASSDEVEAAASSARARKLVRALVSDGSAALAVAHSATAGAEAARAAGESAANRWASAAAAWQAAKRPYRVAYSGFRVAEALARSGAPRDQVEAALRQAHGIAGGLKAMPLSTDIEVLARRLRINLAPSAQASSPAAGVELTQREREVLALIAAGRTNREIGEELFISPKTASVHVSNIFAKLGVDRRVEAVQVANSLGLLGKKRGQAAPPRRPSTSTARRLQTIAFVDIAGSTELLDRIGDRAWRLLLDRFYRALADDAAAHGGREVDRAGDGLLLAFDEPSDAVRCAAAATRSAERLGAPVRVGIHTGEVEFSGGSLRGIAVHMAARIAAAAQPGEVLVSSTVRDLAAGSGLTMRDRGLHALKGISESKRLYSVVH